MQKGREKQTDLQSQAASCAEKFSVVSGSPGTGKTQTLIDRALRLAQNSGSENALIITPHPLSARSILLRLKKIGKAPYPRVLDIFSFAREVIGDKWQRTRFVSALGRFLIMRTLSRSFQFRSRLKNYRYSPGFVQSLSQIVALMREAGISGDSLRLHSPRGSDVLRDLASVLEEYEKTLSEKKLFDKWQIIDNASELIEKGKATLPRHILVDDLQDFSSVEMSLVRAAAQRCETAFFVVDSYEGADSQTQIFSQLFPRESPKFFEFDKRFGAFASLPEAQNAVETRFFTDRLSELLWIADRITELKSKSANAGASFIVVAQNTDSLSLFAGEFERRQVPFFAAPHHFLSRGACARATLSLLGALTDSPGRHLLDLLRLPNVSVSDEVLARVKDCSDKEDPVQVLRSMSNRAQTESVRTLISLIDALKDRKDSLKLREVVDCASKLLCEPNPLLLEFADEFDLCLESGTPVGSLYEIVSGSLLFLSASDAADLPGASVESDETDLQILLPQEISCAEADFVFVPEMQEGAFTLEALRLLLQEEQAAIEQAASGLVGVFPVLSGKDEREYLFRRCASAAERKLFLSCHRTEPGREFLPSAVLRALSPDYASQKVQAFTGFVGEAKVAAPKRRRQTGATVTLGKDFTLSATSINTYLACPRMFYFAHVLGIPEPFISPNMVIGGVMHNVMKGLRQPGGRGVPPDIEKAKEILERELSARAQDFRTPAELEGARRRCIHLLSEYLQLEADWQSEVHAAEEWFEWKFGDFTITGRMDRIDKTGSGFEIVDYKLSGNKKGRGLKNKFLVRKEDFQLPIYYWAAREKLNLDVYAFSYVYFDFNKAGCPEKVTLRFCEEGKADEVILLSQIENAKERLAEIVGEIFTPREDFAVGEDAPCTEYITGCPYRSICVKAQH